MYSVYWVDILEELILLLGKLKLLKCKQNWLKPNLERLLMVLLKAGLFKYFPLILPTILKHRDNCMFHHMKLLSIRTRSTEISNISFMKQVAWISSELQLRFVTALGLSIHRLNPLLHSIILKPISSKYVVFEIARLRIFSIVYEDPLIKTSVFAHTMQNTPKLMNDHH